MKQFLNLAGFLPAGPLTKTSALAAAMLLSFGSSHAVAQRALGIDVSYVQGSNVNWSAVRGSGIAYAWAQAPEGVTVNDPDFVVNENNGKAAGVYIGAYHYAHPNLNTPGAEAGHFWGVANPYIKADGKTLHADARHGSLQRRGWSEHLFHLGERLVRGHRGGRLRCRRQRQTRHLCQRVQRLQL